MQSFTDGLIDQFTQADDAVERRREAFREANASQALEGLVADAAQLARQEEVIQGRLTTAQAVAQCVAEYSVPA